MKIEGIPGEYLSQALISPPDRSSFELCGCFHPSLSAAHIHQGLWVKWPVEIVDGIAYVPSKEELPHED